MAKVTLTFSDALDDNDEPTVSLDVNFDPEIKDPESITPAQSFSAEVLQFVQVLMKSPDGKEATQETNKA